MSSPTTINSQLTQALNWRYATKVFDPTKKISPENWTVLEESLRMAPSSYGLQPWQFIVIQNPELRKKLTPVSWNQPQIETCSHLVVIAILKTVTEEHVSAYLQAIAEIRHTPIEKLGVFRDYILKDVVNGPRHEMAKEWAARQAYIAAGFFMLAAAQLEVDTCPLEGFQPDQYDQLLGLTNSDYGSVMLLAAGYRSPQDASANYPKVRFNADTVIKHL